MIMETTLETAFVQPPGAGDSLVVMGDRITFKFGAATTGGAFTLFEGVVAPGGGEPVHYHEREEETFYVIAGQAEFLLGDTWQAVAVGSTVYIPRGVIHSFRNAGITPLHVLVLNTPGGLHEELFAALSELPRPANPEQGAALIAVAARFGTVMLPPPGA
jgi:mannose-6-phosphate isomerase-like protein (cupin superfamily)